jgi:diguanylate cyclase (GGDEF)-like protein
VLTGATSGAARNSRPAGADGDGRDTRLGARALGYLYLAGATIGLVSLLLPDPPGANLTGLYLNVGLAYLGGGALLLSESRIRAWMLHIALVLGALLITRAVLLSGESVSLYAVWYIWIGLYAFYFCSRAAAAAHVALVAILYGATLAHSPPTSPVARWLTTVATLIVAGVLIDTLVRRARREAAASAASAASMTEITELAHELAALSEGQPARIALCVGAIRVARAARAALWEPAGDGTGLEVSAQAVVGDPPRVVAASGGEAALGEVAFIGPPTAVTNAYTGGTMVTSTAPNFSAWCPIVREQQAVAILELSWPAQAGVGDLTRITLANLLAAEAAVTLERVALLEELETVARTDELTGLPNRRAWQEQLARELGRAQRTGESLAVAMLDLDHFKRYNDTYGHQTGDRLLKQVAGAWSAELRATDVLARYGGEEFGLALPAREAGDALAVVERLRTAMPEGQSCSAGIAIWDRAEPASELLDRADHALYRAKRTGRDRSALAADQTWTASAG